MARRAAAAPPPVTWRDGVHLTGTSIWCDARRRRDVCFVSSADRIGRAGHGQLIGTPATIALQGGARGDLAVPVYRPFTLGTLRLELIPSGRSLGAASLHVDFGGRSVLYAGAIRTAGVDDAAGVRACDAVVVAAPVDVAHFEPLAAIVEHVVAWSRAQLAAGHHAMLVVDNALDGLEVASHLAGAGLAPAGSRSLREAAERASAPAIHMPDRAASVVAIRVAADRLKLPADRPTSTAIVSAAYEPAQGVGFAWPFVAERAQLLVWLEQSRAKDVFITGAAGEAIARVLGSGARALGPPRQMALFGS